MRFAMQLSYNGSNYHGWQAQENVPTVQAEIEKALYIIMQRQVSIIGCGRTDTGVHAKQYTAHFDLEIPLPVNLTHRLNSLLPADIAIHECTQVSETFHARFDAVFRQYRYYIHYQKDPFKQQTSWLRQGNLDFELMNEAASFLVGTKEFKCFCKGEPPNGNYNCQVLEAFWETEESGAIFTISANRFLRNMVRAIVGTLIEVGQHKISIDEFKSILQNGTRSDAGNSVPAHGLFLEKVEYGKKRTIL